MQKKRQTQKKNLKSKKKKQIFFLKKAWPRPRLSAPPRGRAPAAAAATIGGGGAAGGHAAHLLVRRGGARHGHLPRLALNFFHSRAEETLCGKFFCLPTKIFVAKLRWVIYHAIANSIYVNPIALVQGWQFNPGV